MTRRLGDRKLQSPDRPVTASPCHCVVDLKPKRILTLAVSLTITVVFLVLALSQVDWNQLARAFASADYRLVVLAPVFTFAGYIFRATRWRQFLVPSKAIPLVRLFPVLVIGFALNNLLPGRPGEFARPYWLGVREGLSKTLGFATVVAERVADGIALVGFLLLAFLAFAPLGVQLPPIAKTIALLAGVLFGVALLGLLFLLLREAFALAIFRQVTHFLPRPLADRLEKMLGSFTLGLHSLKSPRDAGLILVLSFAVWTCEAFSYFLMLTAFGAMPLGPDRAVAAVFMMVLINLGIMIPAAPGGLGPFEAAGVFALGAFAIDPTTAASVALAAHALQYLLITGLGLVFVWREGLSLAVANE